MKEAATIRIGTAGWTIPRDHAAQTAGAGSHLHRYARIFHCAEINSSFYRPHRLSTWQRWADAVPQDFRFSVKMPKAITHEAALRCPPALLKKFLDEIRGLGAKLGPLLVQLPPKFVFDNARAVEFFSMLRQLHSGPVALEPRHPSWFTRDVDDLLERFHLIRVATDPPRTPHDSEPAGWAALRYFRLHGSPRIYYSSYSEEFLTTLSQQIKTHHAPEISRQTWCIFDNTASGAAFRNAQSLQRHVA